VSVKQSVRSKKWAFSSRLPSLRFAGSFDGSSNPAVSHDVQVWHDNRGGDAIFCKAIDDQYWIWWPAFAAFRFSGVENCVYLYSEPSVSEAAAVDAYRRYILPIIEHVRGRESLHASAVTRDDSAIIFCGDSMDGKSTLAYGLSERGYHLWADDAVVFEMRFGQPCSVPLPFRMHLRSATLSHFKLASDTAYCDSFDDSDEQSCPAISKIFVLQRCTSAGDNGKDCEIAQLLPYDAFITLLTHARCFTLNNTERKQRMMQAYLDLVHAIPVFKVHFRSGFDRLPAVLDDIETQLSLRITDM
jgi:hypothetical protein